MENFYTIIYSVNNYNTTNEEIINIKEILDKKSTFFKNMSNLFEKIKFTPDQEIITNVLNIIRTKELV